MSLAMDIKLHYIPWGLPAIFFNWKDYRPICPGGNSYLADHQALAAVSAGMASFGVPPPCSIAQRHLDERNPLADVDRDVQYSQRPALIRQVAPIDFT
jgi:hypothetical protein